MRYSLTTDGSRSSDNLHIGYSGYISDNNGKILFVFFQKDQGTGIIGDPKNADYELRALKMGLQCALDMGIDELDCYNDFLGMVNICNNAITSNTMPRVKQHQEQYRDIFKLMQQFENINLKHLPREKNKYADYLSHNWKHNTPKLRQEFFDNFKRLGGSMEYDYFELAVAHREKTLQEQALNKKRLKL